MMQRTLTKLVTAVLVAGMLVGLGACEGQVPSVPAVNSDKAEPDLTQAQEKAIRNNILDVIEQASESKNTDELPTRLTGPQLEVRTSEITIARATGTLQAKAAIPRDMTQTVIPVNNGWPRTVFTITTTTDDQQSKRLMVMTQASARQNYKLWGVARLFQGAKLPKFEIPKLGSEMGTAKDSRLVATPADAVKQYCDLLNKGDASRYAGAFATDFFRQDLTKLAATVQQGMEANNGTQEQVFTVPRNQMAIMRSADGGDLVVARIDSVWTRHAGDGRESLPASDEEKALFGDGQATSTMKVTYVNVIALHIPAAGSKQQITAVGAERQPVKVEAL